MTIEQHHWREHWQHMSPIERLRFVFVIFDEADPFDVLYQTSLPFQGWMGWYFTRWDCAD